MRSASSSLWPIRWISHGRIPKVPMLTSLWKFALCIWRIITLQEEVMLLGCWSSYYLVLRNKPRFCFDQRQRQMYSIWCKSVVWEWTQTNTGRALNSAEKRPRLRHTLYEPSCEVTVLGAVPPKVNEVIDTSCVYVAKEIFRFLQVFFSNRAKSDRNLKFCCTQSEWNMN